MALKYYAKWLANILTSKEGLNAIFNPVGIWNNVGGKVWKSLRPYMPEEYGTPAYWEEVKAYKNLIKNLTPKVLAQIDDAMKVGIDDLSLLTNLRRMGMRQEMTETKERWANRVYNKAKSVDVLARFLDDVYSRLTTRTLTVPDFVRDYALGNEITVMQKLRRKSLTQLQAENDALNNELKALGASTTDIRRLDSRKYADWFKEKTEKAWEKMIQTTYDSWAENWMISWMGSDGVEEVEFGPAGSEIRWETGLQILEERFNFDEWVRIRGEISRELRYEYERQSRRARKAAYQGILRKKQKGKF